MVDNHTELESDREWLVNQIAHALRNPIFAATVQTEALHLRANDPTAIIRTVDALHGQLQRLSTNIDEMLLYGRPVRPIIEDVPVAEVLNSLATRYRNGDREKPAAVILAELDPRLSGRWDRAAVTIILERILDNAVQHTEPPHEIELAAASNCDDEVVFTISDRGAGIPPEILDRATLPFFPQHSGRPGLGLAIADKLTRTFGGRIEIETAVDAGTVVRCILPIRGDQTDIR